MATSRLRKFSFQTEHSDAPKDGPRKRLDQFLAERLPGALGQPLSKAKVRKLIVAGAVYLNGRRVRIASKELVARARVEVFLDLRKLLAEGPGQDRPFRMSASDVLFEDEYLILVNKPPGLPTQPTLDEARANLFASVKRFLQERDGSPQPYVGLHHRLDRDTSGVILFTKRTEANAGVAELFAKHLAVKTYQALTVPARDVPDRWEVRNHLGRDRTAGGKQTRYTQVRSGGDFAHTDFRVLERMKEGFRVEAIPRTGRTHQIRVHLSENGLPILGDPTYGAPGASGKSIAPRLMLHAVNLTFPHPIHKNEVSVSSPLPEDFTRCLDQLRAHGS